MKAIGQTEAGTLIIEMTPEEWSLVSSGPEVVVLRTGNPEKVVPSKAVADEFCSYLDKFALRGKVRQSLHRALGYWYKEYSDRRFNLSVFALGNEYISPEEWRSAVAKTRRFDVALLSLRNFGPGSLQELKDALRNV